MLPAVRRVGYRVIELDHGNRAFASYFFSEVGTTEPSLRNGDVLLHRTIAVPGVQYLEITRPDPSATTP